MSHIWPHILCVWLQRLQSATVPFTTIKWIVADLSGNYLCDLMCHYDSERCRNGPQMVMCAFISYRSIYSGLFNELLSKLQTNSVELHQAVSNSLTTLHVILLFGNDRILCISNKQATMGSDKVSPLFPNTLFVDLINRMSCSRRKVWPQLGSNKLSMLRYVHHGNI